MIQPQKNHKRGEEGGEEASGAGKKPLEIMEPICWGGPPLLLKCRRLWRRCVDGWERPAALQATKRTKTFADQPAERDNRRGESHNKLFCTAADGFCPFSAAGDKKWAGAETKNGG
ncbi:hypothetical protein niasHS_014367 [Heterodera schachtii]|uniref:Uncharacterized protein n=1 Tax=Heterodera schachtii TaxID=97005 RepID=A0ABD2I764_HETSC